MYSKINRFMAYHDQMVAWRAQGLSFLEIAVQLQAQGVPATKGQVYNHFVKEGLPTVDPPKSPARPAMPNSMERDLFDDAAQELCDPEPPVGPPSPPASPASSASSPPTSRRAVRLISATLPETPAPPVQPVALRFTDIDAWRAHITALLQRGHSPEDIYAALQPSGLQVAMERLTAYVDGLREELFPEGPIPQKLFEIQPGPSQWPDDLPLLTFQTGEETDVWSCADFARGTVIFGAVGSSKTTGSGRNIATSLLYAGYGGMILTFKQNEGPDWRTLIKRCNREADVALIKPRGGLRCNLLQYATAHPGAGREFTENMVAFFRNLVSVVAARGGYREGEKFWALAGDELIRQTINLRLLAGDGLTLDNMCELIVHAPGELAAAAEDHWPTLPVFGDCLQRAKKAALSPGQRRVLKRLEEYWLYRYPDLNPNTRSCITFSFSTMVDALRDEHIHDLLSTYTNITPESIFNDGRLIILELPVAQFEHAGVMTQAAWKYCFLRAALRRADFGTGAQMRPVFLWEDEFASHLIDFDPEFMRVGREYRVARVMLTQNIQNLYDHFGGGADAKTKVDSLLGNVNTRIFHANGDHATNSWASESYGSHERAIEESSATPQVYSGFDPFMSFMYQFKKPVVTRSRRIVREPLVHPHEFLHLRNGGKTNGFLADAFVSQVGRIFSDGSPVRKMTFEQILFSDPHAQTRASMKTSPKNSHSNWTDRLRSIWTALRSHPAR